MYSKIKLFGHPIHPMIVAFPITSYTVAFAGFLAFQLSGNAYWYKTALYSNYAGVFTALLAAVPGFLDWYLGIPKVTAAKQRGLLHAGLNEGALLLFAINALAFRGTANTASLSWTPVLLTGVGLLLTLAAGYHGFALTATHKVGVDLTPEQERLEHQRELRRAA